MKHWLAIALLFISSLAVAQRPQPVLEAGGVLNGSGMSPLGGAAFAGITLDTKHFVTIDEAGYTTGGKTNDNDNTSSSGHTRLLSGGAFLHEGKYLFGPSCEWDKLYTPDYHKSAVHPKATVGRDFNNSRVFISYVFSGTDTANAIEGVEGRAFLAINRHAFLSTTIGGYWGHATVIPVSEGGSPASVASELATKIMTGKTTIVLGWRF